MMYCVLCFVGWLFCVLIAASIVRFVAPRVVFANSYCQPTHFVSASALYALIRANSAVAPRLDADSDYYMHLAYDFEDRSINLLRVTRQTITRIARYALPSDENIHVRFDRSWDDLTKAASHSVPALQDIVQLVDRQQFISAVRVAALAPFDQPLRVRLVDQGRSIEYVDAHDNALRLALPSTMLARFVRVAEKRVRVELVHDTPCSQPSVVKYGDFVRFYLGGQPSSGLGDRILPQFQWRCLNEFDSNPILAPQSPAPRAHALPLERDQ